MKERMFALPCVTSMRKERRIFYICQEKNKDKGNTWEKVKKSEK